MACLLAPPFPDSPQVWFFHAPCLEPPKLMRLAKRSSKLRPQSLRQLPSEGMGRARPGFV